MVKVFVKTYGCAANQARGEKLAGTLANAGYELCELADADVIILNTCSLKTPTENTMFRFIRENATRKIIVAGCFPLSFPDDERLKNSSLVGTYNFDKISAAIEKTLKGEKVRLLDRVKTFLACEPKRKNKLIAKIEIGTGCLGNCAYCAGKLAHGALKSKPIEAILEEVRSAVASSCKEIWLFSQDNGCYGFDMGTNIVELLQKIVVIEGEFFVRVGMMNPEWVLRSLPELIEVYRHPKVYKFLHVPVQSGDDGILKAMFRRYNVDEFRRVVEAFRKSIPNTTLATDVIVGLPGETAESFKNTLNLIEEIQPEVLNISRYWERENTAAARMTHMHHKHSKELSRKLDKFYNELAVKISKKWVGKTVSVLFTGLGSKKNQYRGRNIFYKPILVNSENNLLGKTKSVRIAAASKDHLLGELN